MKMRREWMLALLSLGLAIAARAEKWRSLDGQQWDARLSGVYGSVAVFAEKSASRQVPINSLDETGLERVADFLAQQKAAPTAWSTSASPVAKALRNRLQVLQGEKLVAFNSQTRPEPEIYLVYFGALWCGPCVRFSPELVRSYERLKAVAGDRFELVFISSDRGGGEQLEYVKKVRMPWPILKFSAVGDVRVLERWSGRGIPCLIAVTREGDVIFHSYRGEEYIGPKHVLNETTRLLQTMSGDASRPNREMHRLAVMQHTRAAAGGNAGPTPYLISFNPARYRTLELKQLTAEIEIDERGQVTSAAFAPKLEAVIEYQLIQDANSWLFLPEVADGKPRARRVQLPLKLD